MKKIFEDVINEWIDDYSLEELFEQLDLDPADVLFRMYEAGLIDEDRFEDFLDLEEDEEDV